MTISRSMMMRSDALLVGSEWFNLVTADNPQYWFRLSEPSGTVAINDGSKSNGVYTGTSVALNQAGVVSADDIASAQFSGSGKLDGGTYQMSDDGFTTSTPITIELIFRANTDWSASEFRPLLAYISSSSASLQTIWIGTRATAGSTNLAFFTRTNSGIVEISDTGILPAGNYHIICVADPATGIILYKNGSVLLNHNSSFLWQSSAVTGPVPLTIGNTSTSAVSSLDNDISEAIMYFDQAMSPVEVTERFNALSSTYPETISFDNPIGYWRLGESSGTVAVDETGSNNGTYVNTPTLGVTGLLIGDSDTAVSFNQASAEHIDFDESFSFSVTDTFSLEAVINTSSAPGVNNKIITKQHDSTVFHGYTLHLFSNGRLEFMFRGSDNNEVQIISTAAFGTLVDGTTRHVVITYDGTFSVAGTKMYIDGVEHIPDTVSDTLLITSDPSTPSSFNIAGIGDGQFGQGWNGELDEIAIYDVVLTPAQVLNHFNAGF